MREIIHRNKRKTEFPTKFIKNEETITDKTKIANKFNEFFTGIGPELANKIQTKNGQSYKSYLAQKHSSNFIFNLVSSEDISKIILKLKRKSSSGHDTISSKLLNFISPIIVKPLSTIINQSLHTGIFPDSLKLTKVLPFYKKGDN